MKHDYKHIVRRILELNSWIGTFDKEEAKAAYLALDLPMWYIEKCAEWAQERDDLISQIDGRW
jgi:hypothetical protein